MECHWSRISWSFSFFSFPPLSSFHHCSILKTWLPPGCVIALPRRHIITSWIFKLGASPLTRHLTGSRVRKCLYRTINCEMHKSTSLLNWTVCYTHKPYSATITNSTGQSPFWETDTHSISQEICHLLWTPKIYYHAHKSLLYQKNPVHTLTSKLLKIHFNIIPPIYA